MENNIYDIMMNPVRMRIIQTVGAVESITATEVCLKINDIPRTTVYRHISILINADVLIVVNERKIRGSIERTIALNIEQLSKHNTTDNIPQQALRFLMNTYSKFEKYFSKERKTPSNNVIFFNNTVLMMDDQEFNLFLSELQALLLKYQFDVKHGRKLRDISIISSPIESEN